QGPDRRAKPRLTSTFPTLEIVSVKVDQGELRGDEHAPPDGQDQTHGDHQPLEPHDQITPTKSYQPGSAIGKAAAGHHHGAVHTSQCDQSIGEPAMRPASASGMR